MYRKITFLFVNLFEFSLDLKTAILLLVSFFSIYSIKQCSPFESNQLNHIELISNTTVCLILFGGSLYIKDIGIYPQAFIFTSIIIFNSSFLGFWLFALVKTLLIKNLPIMKNKCPNLIVRYLFIEKTLTTIKERISNLANFFNWFEKDSRTNKKTEMERVVKPKIGLQFSMPIKRLYHI